jgi:hypothetical protein
MSEEWRSIKGYEGWYSVSNHGRVRRDRSAKNTYAGRILKPSAESCGYLQAHLCRGGVKRKMLLHLIVAAAFIGPCQEGKQVNHIDGVKLNNDVHNLEYVTASENMLHSFRLGLQKPVRGEKHGNSKLTENDVHTIRKMSSYKTQTEIADIFGIDHATISDIARGRSWGWLKEAA